MIQVPTQVQDRFKGLLVKRDIPEKYHSHYLKWLRYYLDFCRKYGFEQSGKESLGPFLQKLNEKKQSEQQQKQASNAISMYYEIGADLGPGEDGIFKDKNEIRSTKKEYLKSKNANWIPVYDALNAEIKLRHYSPKTLKAYTGWARHFQSYTKSKDPRLLSPADVKDFLTFLAVNVRFPLLSESGIQCAFA